MNRSFIFRRTVKAMTELSNRDNPPQCDWRIGLTPTTALQCSITLPTALYMSIAVIENMDYIEYLKCV